MNEKPFYLPLRVVFPILFAYLAVCILGLYNHELWLDEAQHFLIGRDSDSPWALYWNMRYDGHPRLWNLLIWLVTHFISPSYLSMQVLHLCITTATAFVFLRYAPFSVLQKILILAGYYFIFEFSVLSRNYALGILVLFGICILLREPRRHLLSIGLLLFLLCNTHLFFAFAAMGVFFYMAAIYGKKEWLTARFLFFGALFLAGFVLVIIQTRTPPEENFNQVHPAEWLTGNNLSFTAFGLIRGWLPIPQVRGGHFWNSYWINSQHIGGWLRNILFLFFLLFPAAMLRQSPKALVFYYTALAFLLAFFDVTQQTGTRYFGMAYIYFLAASWMSTAGKGAGTRAWDVQAGSPWMRKLLLFSLYAILVVNIAIGGIAFQQDLTRPFSQARNAVKWLEMQRLAEEKIIVDGYNCGPMISAYLGRRVYYITLEAEGSYLIWKTSYWPRPRPTLGREIAGSPYLQHLPSYILVSNRRLDEGMVRAGDRSFQVTALKEFLNSIEQEDYYLYRVRAL